MNELEIMKNILKDLKDKSFPYFHYEDLEKVLNIIIENEPNGQNFFDSLWIKLRKETLLDPESNFSNGKYSLLVDYLIATLEEIYINKLNINTINCLVSMLNCEKHIFDLNYVLTYKPGKFFD